MPLTGDLKKDIAIIYTGVFGRAPEKQGLDYWYKQAIQNNWDLKDLAENMYAAATSFPAYQNLTNPQELIETLYENILGKLPQEDPEGIAYWTNLLQNGNKTAGEAISGIVYAALTQYPDNPATKTLLNRAEASLLVAEKFEDADIDDDGEIEDTDFEVFKKIVKVVKDKPEDIQKIELHLDEISQDPSKIDLFFSEELQDYVEDNNQNQNNQNQEIDTIFSDTEKFLAHVYKKDGSNIEYREDIYLLTSGEGDICISDSDVYPLPEKTLDLSGVNNINTIISMVESDLYNDIVTYYVPEDYILNVEKEGEYYAIMDIKMDDSYTVNYKIEFLKDNQKGEECENSGLFKKVYTLDFNLLSGDINLVYADDEFVNSYTYIEDYDYSGISEDTDYYIYNYDNLDFNYDDLFTDLYNYNYDYSYDYENIYDNLDFNYDDLFTDLYNNTNYEDLFSYEEFCKAYSEALSSYGDYSLISFYGYNINLNDILSYTCGDYITS